MPERVPPRRGDVDRYVTRIGGIGSAPRAVVAPRNHEPQRICPYVENEVSPEATVRRVDGGGPVEACIRMGQCVGDVEVDVHTGLISTRRKDRRISAPIRIWAVVDRCDAPAERAVVGARVLAEPRVIA